MWRIAKKIAMVSAVVGAAMALAPSLYAQQFIVGGSGDPSIEIDLSVIEGGGTSVAPAPRTPRLLFPGARLKPDEAVVLRPLPPGARRRITSTTLTGRGHVHRRARARRPALRLKLPSTRRAPQLQWKPPSSVTGLRFPAPPQRITLRKPGTKVKKSAQRRRKVTVKRAKQAKAKITRRTKAKAPPRVMTKKVARQKPSARKDLKKTARKALPPLKTVSPPPMKASSKPLKTSPVKVATTPPPPKPAKKIPTPRLAAPPPPPDISKPPRLARRAPAKLPRKTIKPKTSIKPKTTTKKAAPPPPQPPSGQQTAMLVPAPSIAPGTALRIPFPTNVAKLPKQATPALRALAQRLAKNNAIRLQLKAYASGTKDNASRARRLSLSRALAVRSYLIRQGVRSTRIDVRALGNKAEGPPANRVDLIVVSR